MVPLEEQARPVHRLFEEIWNQGKVDVADDIFAEGHIGHYPAGSGTGRVHGVEQLKQLVSKARTMHPDVELATEDLIVDGEMVIVRWVCGGADPTDPEATTSSERYIPLTGVTICRVTEGKIVRSWTSWDPARLRSHLNEHG